MAAEGGRSSVSMGLGRSVTVLATGLLAVTGVLGCGGSTSSSGAATRASASLSASSMPTSATADSQRHSELQACLSQWNSDVNGHTITQGYPSGTAALVVRFLGSECGIVFRESPSSRTYGVSAFANRGSGFEAFLNTQFGAVTDIGIQQGRELAEQAQKEANAEVSPGKEVVTSAEADIISSPITAEPKNGDASEARQRETYAMNAAGWSRLSGGAKAEALSRFFLDSRDKCDKAQIVAVAHEIHDGSFYVVGGVQLTLHHICDLAPSPARAEQSLNVPPNKWYSYRGPVKLRLAGEYLREHPCPYAPSTTPAELVESLDNTLHEEPEFSTVTAESQAEFLCEV